MKRRRSMLLALGAAVLLLLCATAPGAGAGIPSSAVPPPQPSPALIRLAGLTFDPLDAAGRPPLPPTLQLDGYAPEESGHYLIQLRGPIQPQWKEAMLQAGARLYDYIPDFSFLARLDAGARSRVEALPFVRWVGLYQPAYRLAPGLLATADRDAESAPTGSPGEGWDARPLLLEAETLSLTVLIFADEDVQAAAGALRALGGVVHDVAHSQWKGTIHVDLPAESLDEAALVPAVEWIEPAPEWKLANNVAAEILNVREAWDSHGLHGAGQIVAIADSGLDQGSADPAALHDDFEDGLGGSRVVALFDRVGDGANDVNSGHGTHVAGSVLGNGQRSGSDPASHGYPDTAYVGMAPEAGLVFQAVEENTTGDLTGIPTDLNTLFGQAYDAGARVHSNSWGAAVDGAYTSQSQDVDEFVWDHPEMAILFVAGNAGEDADGDGRVDRTSLDAPGTAKNAITVGATESLRPPGSSPTPSYDFVWGTENWARYYPMNPIVDDHVSDDAGGMAAFSGRGPTLDGRTKPDVVAPGTNIISVRSSVASGTLWGEVNGDYLWSGGTSMATPLVAGAAALVREQYSHTHGVEPSAAMVKAILANGAQDLAPGQYGSPVPYWHVETVDSSGRVAPEISMALDASGRPHISYEDWDDSALKYAWRDGSTWHIETVDSYGSVGQDPSLALDALGHPHISYYDSSNYDLKYAWHDGSTWHIETVDSYRQVGDYTSLALDSQGRPHISYHSYTGEDLKYAWHDGSTWHVETVDSEGKAGRGTSLALDSLDHRHISYLDFHDLDDDFLKYAWHDGSTWHVETVDTGGGGSLALDALGRPHISYSSGYPNYDPRYAWHDGTRWYTETVASGAAGWLALDRSGHPHIAYIGGHAVNYARFDGSTWHKEAVDTEGWVRARRLALDVSDRPHIAYEEYIHQDLKYAYLATGPLAGPAEISTRRPNSVEGWGRVDLAGTLFPSAPLTTTFVDQSPGLQTGETDTYTLAVAQPDQALRVTLAWSDYPGSPVAAGGLVNDFDLVVKAPGGGSFYPTHASQRGAAQYLAYDDGSYTEVWRWEGYGSVGFAMRFTPNAYPAIVHSAQFFLVVSEVSGPYFQVRVLDDDGDFGNPGTVLWEKTTSPVADGWFTVDLGGIPIADGDFYIEFHFVGAQFSVAPYLALDRTSPHSGRSYIKFDSEWCTLPCEGINAGDWAIRAAVSTPGVGTEADRVNNLVGVDVWPTAQGTYTVEVRGYNVPQGPQPYALVMSTRSCGPLTDVDVAGPISSTVGAMIPFTATVQPSATMQPVDYAWQATGQSAITRTNGLSDTEFFAWDTTGTQAITVTATNGCGIAITTHVVTIYDPPRAAFAASPIIGPVPLTVQFTNLSTGDYDTCTWAFGDDDTSDDCNGPSHVYTSGGVYTVALTVSGPDGSNTETKGAYITTREVHNVYLPVIMRLYP